MYDHIEERIARHSKGYVPATRSHLPVKKYQTFQDFVRAGKSSKEFSCLNAGSSDAKLLQDGVLELILLSL